MKRLAALTGLMALLYAAPLGAKSAGGPLGLRITTGYRLLQTPSAFPFRGTRFRVKYERNTNTYRLPDMRGFDSYRFTTTPHSELPKAMTFMVHGDDFEGFQLAAKGMVLKVASSRKNHIETVSFRDPKTHKIKHWRAKSGTYFDVASSRAGYGLWRVKLMPVALKLLRYPCVFLVKAQFDRD